MTTHGIVVTVANDAHLNDLHFRLTQAFVFLAVLLTPAMKLIEHVVSVLPS